MLFNSYEFIFVLLPLMLIGFFAFGRFANKSLALAWLVAGSLFFYGWWNPAYLIIICISTVSNFYVGNAIYHAENRSRAKFLCTIGIVVNVSVLVYYKYMNFFVNNVNAVAGTHFQLEAIVLPLAISFFTFQQISFLVDAYSKKAHEQSFLNYCLFVTFFPQLIAGPIVHHGEMLPQFAKDELFRFKHSHLAVGLSIFLLGLFKKVVLADGISVYATPVFSAAYAGETLTFVEAWGGALAYTFQIYFDFSGYSDMAIGLARMFGVILPLNFNSPYKSTSIIEFWRRWHMTLSRFLRDYIYIPLGGNRKGPNRRHVNLMIVMLVGGLWHGAGWTFVVWGGLHGTFLVINHFWAQWAQSMGWRFRSTIWWAWIARALTLLVVIFAWVFFRAESFTAALDLCYAMLGGNGLTFPAEYLHKLNNLGGLGGLFASLGANFGSAPYFVKGSTVLHLLVLLGICWLLPNTQEIMRKHSPALDFQAGKEPGLIGRMMTWHARPLTACLLLLVALYTFTSMTGVSEFLYFQF